TILQDEKHPRGRGGEGQYHDQGFSLSRAPALPLSPSPTPGGTWGQEKKCLTYGPGGIPYERAVLLGGDFPQRWLGLPCNHRDALRFCPSSARLTYVPSGA